MITTYEEALGVMQRVLKGVSILNDWAHIVGSDLRDDLDELEGQVRVVKDKMEEAK